MENNHLTYFKVENFKKFDSLEVNDIGQFNLIVGDNNVGKTCLLEALLFDEDEKQLISNFWIGLTKRGLRFQIEEVTKKMSNSSITETLYPKENYFLKYIFGKLNTGLKFNFSQTNKNSYTSIYIGDEVEVSLEANRNENKINKIESQLAKGIKLVDFYNQFISFDNGKIFLKNVSKFFWIYDYNENILNFPLISFNDTPLEEETIRIYETLRTKQEKEILLNALKVVNDKIVGIDFRGSFNDLKSVFLIIYEDQDEFFPLNFMGDGFKRIFYIVLKMLSLRGKRILIDEIEIGVHYSKMKDFWVNIFKVCKELDVQLFATTHSNECIEAFMEASKEINEKNIRLIRLQENKDKSIKAICYKEEYIEYMVESNTEER